MGANTHKGTNGITLQKDYEFFLAIFIFSYERILNEIFCNLLLKIHTVAPIDHMVCVNQCWINMKISKCVDFAKLCVSFWNFIIISNHTKLCYLIYVFFLYHKLQLCFVCNAHYTPFTYVLKDSWEFKNLKNTHNFFFKKKFISFKLWMLLEFG